MKKPPSEDLFVCTGLAPEEETNQGKRFTDFINDSKLSSGFNEEKDDPEVGLNGDAAYIEDNPNSRAKGSSTNDSKETREENQGSQCKHCGLKVGEGDEMRSKVVSDGEVNIKCFHCNNPKDQLKLQTLKHNNDTKLFKCGECDYQCRHRGSFKIHLLTHENVMMFKCCYCHYESNHKGHFKRHLLTHGNLRLLKCSECPYECNERGNMKTHMLGHKNIKLFKCPHCPYECNNNGNLKRHLL
ncbi:hypothetical protein Avbf_16300, partial [Armadillidium vulgare]